MMNIIRKKPIGYFLLAEGLLYVSFLVGDLLAWPTDGSKFLSIGLCVGLTWTRARQKREWWVPAALLLSFAADACLLFGGSYLLGAVCFSSVQTLLAARLMWLRSRLRRFKWRDHIQSVAWRISVYGASLVVLRLVAEATGTDLLTILHAAALKSFSQLSVNVAEAWHLQRFEPRVRSFAVGLSLFWACDLCVGLRYLLADLTGPMAESLLAPITYGIWFFYLPAQVCLALAETPPIQKGGT